jgi:hypothetical protein
MLSIGRSSYYSWLKKQPGKRALANLQLDQKIIHLFNAHQSRSGAPRITKDLQDICNGQVNPDIFLGCFFIKFIFKFQWSFII